MPILQQVQRADSQRLIQEWSGKSQTFFSSFRVHRNKITVHCFRLENWVMLRSHSFLAPVSSPLLLSNTQTKSKLERKGVILSYTSRSHSLPLREVKAGIEAETVEAGCSLACLNSCSARFFIQHQEYQPRE